MSIKKILEDARPFLETVTENVRGGWYPEIDYGNCDEVSASYFHYVQDVEGDPLLLTQADYPPLFQDLMGQFTEEVLNTWHSHFNLSIGEICIRTLYYEPNNRERSYSKYVHTDYDALTVPLYDSSHPLRKPFFHGEMVNQFQIPEFENLEPYNHTFKSAPEARIYVVAFCQLPFYYKDCWGFRYKDVLTDLINQETGVKKNY